METRVMFHIFFMYLFLQCLTETMVIHNFEYWATRLDPAPREDLKLLHHAWGWDERGSRATVTSLVAQMVKNLPAMQEAWVWSLGWEDPLEKGMATLSNILARRIPWTEEPGGLYRPWGLQRVRHAWVRKHMHAGPPRLFWQTTPSRVDELPFPSWGSEVGVRVGVRVGACVLWVKPSA